MNVNNSLRCYLSTIVLTMLSLLMCTGCNSEFRNDVDDFYTQDNETVSYAIENNEEYSLNSYSASEKKIVGNSEYSPVNSARRKEKGFYKDAEKTYENIDVRRYSLETYADLYLRVNDYLQMMNNTTKMLNALKIGDDATNLFEIVYHLEEMSLDLENEIEVDKNLSVEPRKSLEKARKAMSNAAKSAWKRLYDGTSTSKSTTSKTTTSTRNSINTTVQTTSTNPTKDDESDEIMFNSFDLIVFLVFFASLFGGIIFLLYFKNNNESKQTNKTDSTQMGVDEDSVHSSLSQTTQTKGTKANDHELSNEHRMTSNKGIQSQGSMQSFMENDETIETSVEETFGYVCNINYFINRCKEIARSQVDSTVKATEVRELITECNGRASYVYCINEDEAYDSSRVTPIFSDSKKMKKFLRFDRYLIPSPTIQFDDQKDSLYTFASIERIGYVSAIVPGELGKTGNNQYKLIQKGKWTV